MNKRIAKKILKYRFSLSYTPDQLRRALCRLRYGHVARTAIIGNFLVERA